MEYPLICQPAVGSVTKSVLENKYCLHWFCDSDYKAIGLRLDVRKNRM